MKMAKKKAYKSDKSALTRAMVLFARNNNFVIHPWTGCSYYVENFRLLSCCACAPERKRCPCKEARDEINTRGKCKCGLFFKSYDCYLAYDPGRSDDNLLEKLGETHGNTGAGAEPDRGV